MSYPDRIMEVAEAVAIMRDWPAGRVRRCVKLGAPTHEIEKPGKPGKKPRKVLAVRPAEVVAWAAAQEEALRIEAGGYAEASRGRIVPEEPPPLWLRSLLSRASDAAMRMWDHACIGWDTKRSRTTAPHYRLSRKRDNIVLRCGKCLEVRLRVSLSTAWPVTLREPAL